MRFIPQSSGGRLNRMRESRQRFPERPGNPNLFNNVVNGYNASSCTPGDSNVPEGESWLLYFHLPYSKITNNLIANIASYQGDDGETINAIEDQPTKYQQLAVNRRWRKKEDATDGPLVKLLGYGTAIRGFNTIFDTSDGFANSNISGGYYASESQGDGFINAYVEKISDINSNNKDRELYTERMRFNSGKAETIVLEPELKPEVFTRTTNIVSFALTKVLANFDKDIANLIGGQIDASTGQRSGGFINPIVDIKTGAVSIEVMGINFNAGIPDLIKDGIIDLKESIKPVYYTTTASKSTSAKKAREETIFQLLEAFEIPGEAGNNIRRVVEVLGKLFVFLADSTDNQINIKAHGFAGRPTHLISGLTGSIIKGASTDGKDEVRTGVATIIGSAIARDKTNNVGLKNDTDHVAFRTAVARAFAIINEYEHPTERIDSHSVVFRDLKVKDREIEDFEFIKKLDEVVNDSLVDQFDKVVFGSARLNNEGEPNPESGDVQLVKDGVPVIDKKKHPIYKTGGKLNFEVRTTVALASGDVGDGTPIPLDVSSSIYNTNNAAIFIATPKPLHRNQDTFDVMYKDFPQHIGTLIKPKSISTIVKKLEDVIESKPKAKLGLTNDALSLEVLSREDLKVYPPIGVFRYVSEAPSYGIDLFLCTGPDGKYLNTSRKVYANVKAGRIVNFTDLNNGELSKTTDPPLDADLQAVITTENYMLYNEHLTKRIELYFDYEGLAKDVEITEGDFKEAVVKTTCVEAEPTTLNKEGTSLYDSKVERFYNDGVYSRNQLHSLFGVMVGPKCLLSASNVIRAANHMTIAQPVIVSRIDGSNENISAINNQQANPAISAMELFHGIMHDDVLGSNTYVDAIIDDSNCASGETIANDSTQDPGTYQYLNLLRATVAAETAKLLTVKYSTSLSSSSITSAIQSVNNKFKKERDNTISDEVVDYNLYLPTDVQDPLDYCQLREPRDYTRELPAFLRHANDSIYSGTDDIGKFLPEEINWLFPVRIKTRDCNTGSNQDNIVDMRMYGPLKTGISDRDIEVKYSTIPPVATITAGVQGISLADPSIQNITSDGKLNALTKFTPNSPFGFMELIAKSDEPDAYWNRYGDYLNDKYGGDYRSILEVIGYGSNPVVTHGILYPIPFSTGIGLLSKDDSEHAFPLWNINQIKIPGVIETTLDNLLNNIIPIDVDVLLKQRFGDQYTEQVRGTKLPEELSRFLVTALTQLFELLRIKVTGATIGDSDLSIDLSHLLRTVVSDNSDIAMYENVTSGNTIIAFKESGEAIQADIVDPTSNSFKAQTTAKLVRIVSKTTGNKSGLTIQGPSTTATQTTTAEAISTLDQNEILSNWDISKASIARNPSQDKRKITEDVLGLQSKVGGKETRLKVDDSELQSRLFKKAKNEIDDSQIAVSIEEAIPKIIEGLTNIISLYDNFLAKSYRLPAIILPKELVESTTASPDILEGLISRFVKVIQEVNDQLHPIDFVNRILTRDKNKDISKPLPIITSGGTPISRFYINSIIMDIVSATLLSYLELIYLCNIRRVQASVAAQFVADGGTNLSGGNPEDTKTKFVLNLVGPSDIQISSDLTIPLRGFYLFKDTANNNQPMYPIFDEVFTNESSNKEGNQWQTSIGEYIEPYKIGPLFLNKLNQWLGPFYDCSFVYNPPPGVEFEETSIVSFPYGVDSQNQTPTLSRVLRDRPIRRARPVCGAFTTDPRRTESFVTAMLKGDIKTIDVADNGVRKIIEDDAVWSHIVTKIYHNDSLTHGNTLPTKKCKVPLTALKGRYNFKAHFSHLIGVLAPIEVKPASVPFKLDIAIEFDSSRGIGLFHSDEVALIKDWTYKPSGSNPLIEYDRNKLLTKSTLKGSTVWSLKGKSDTDDGSNQQDVVDGIKKIWRQREIVQFESHRQLGYSLLKGILEFAVFHAPPGNAIDAPDDFNNEYSVMCLGSADPDAITWRNRLLFDYWGPMEAIISKPETYDLNSISNVTIESPTGEIPPFSLAEGLSSGEEWLLNSNDISAFGTTDKRKIMFDNLAPMHNFNLSTMRAFNLYSTLVDRDNYASWDNEHNVDTSTLSFTKYYNGGERTASVELNSNQWTASSNSGGSQFSLITYSPFYSGYIGGLLVSDEYSLTKSTLESLVDQSLKTTWFDGFDTLSTMFNSIKQKKLDDIKEAGGKLDTKVFNTLKDARLVDVKVTKVDVQSRKLNNIAQEYVNELEITYVCERGGDVEVKEYEIVFSSKFNPGNVTQGDQPRFTFDLSIKEDVVKIEDAEDVVGGGVGKPSISFQVVLDSRVAVAGESIAFDRTKMQQELSTLRSKDGDPPSYKTTLSTNKIDKTFARRFILAGFVRSIAGNVPDNTLRSKSISNTNIKFTENEALMEYFIRSFGKNAGQLRTHPRNGVTGFHGALVTSYLDIQKFMFGEGSHYWDFPQYYNLKGVGGMRSIASNPLHTYTYIKEQFPVPGVAPDLGHTVVVTNNEIRASNELPVIHAKFGTLREGSAINEPFDSNTGEISSLEVTQPGLTKTARGPKAVKSPDDNYGKLELFGGEGESEVTYGIVYALYRYMIKTTKASSKKGEFQVQVKQEK